MKLLALYLRDFRNYEKAAIRFSPNINYIYGKNGQGKTNLLEAIYLLITGRSFRTPHLRDLIRFQASSFYIEAHFEKNGIEQVLKFSYNEQGRKIIHNATAIPTVSSLLGILNGVIISPEDQKLISGAPKARRQFLDLMIAQTNPLYLYHLSRYFRAMKQRNHLFRHRKMLAIEAWEEQMAQSAAYLTLYREQTTTELEKQIHPLVRTLSGNADQLRLIYRSSALACTKREHGAVKNYFLKQFEIKRPREYEIGSTLTGPHRDDLEILLCDKEAHLFASEGQKRCSVTSLRLAQWSRLHTLAGEMPGPRLSRIWSVIRPQSPCGVVDRRAGGDSRYGRRVGGRSRPR